MSDIPINFSNPASQAALVSDPTLGRPGINNQFVDAFRYTGGFEYQATKDLLLRFGAGYDETPVPNAQLRPTRIPDGDRILLSAGLKYHAASFKSPIFNQHVDADVELAYLHEFVHDPTIDSVDTSGHRVVGKYNEQINVANIALIFRYGPQRQEVSGKEGKEVKDRSK